jgi:luciferase-like monooxygenase
MVASQTTCAPEVHTNLVRRRGPRPRTAGVLPAIQLDQWPEAVMIHRLLDRAIRLPHVRARQSRMASPDAHALYVSDTHASGPGDAFIDGHEFCHLHAVPEGSIHLTLPPPIRESAIALGWAEEHPVVRAGSLSKCLVMAYAPRDEAELEAVMELITASWNFAQGRF